MTVAPVDAGPMLLVAALCAPLVAVEPGDGPKVCHAAEMETIIAAWPLGVGQDPEAEITAPCGATGLLLLAQGEHAAEWPPAVRKMPPGWTRCRPCWVATGQRRPRCWWERVAP